MKILVIQTAFPGDAILTLPLIQELNKKYPPSKIDVLCIPTTSIIFRASEAVDKVIEFNKRGEHSGLIPLIKFISKLHKEKYNTIYSPHRSARSALITYFTSPKKSFSFNKSSLSFLYKTVVEYREDWHEVRRNLALLDESYSNEEWKILPKIEIKDENKKLVDAKLNKISDSKLIGIAPGSVWQTKRYPKEYFKVIAEKLTGLGYSVAVIGGKDDNSLAEEICNGNSKIFNFCNVFSFIQSIYLLSRVQLLISNDSAPTHLGMCADIPVLTVYCSTVPEFGFYPYNGQSEYISYNDLDCKPCGIHGFKSCPEVHFNCGLNLTPEAILSKALSMLGTQRHSHHN